MIGGIGRYYAVVTIAGIPCRSSDIIGMRVIDDIVQRIVEIKLTDQ